jgi:hypothetical protein
MAWARLDDGFGEHDKVWAVLEHENGAAALGLWLLAWSWAHRNTRKKGKVPGRLPANLPQRLLGPTSRSLAAILTQEKLWDEADGGGWDIHDFGDYLPSKEVSATRAEAGRRGAEARWGANRADGSEPSSDGKAHGKTMADAWQDGSSELFPQPGDAPPSDGNQPSSDGSEPSSDGKAMASGMANDGSRVPTRVHPIPVKEPTPSGVGREPTVNQRAQAITRAYCDVVPLSKFPAVLGIVKRAITANRYSDPEIQAAVLRLAAEGRSVTVETLRTELEGLPVRNNGQQKPSTTDQRFAAAQALKDRFTPSGVRALPGAAS